MSASDNPGTAGNVSSSCRSLAGQDELGLTTRIMCNRIHNTTNRREAMTGLPIDFQIQRQSEANEKHDGPRSALGIHRHLDCARRRAAAQEAE